MPHASRVAVFAVLLAACTVASAQVTLYQQPGLRGRAFSTNGAVPNLEHYGFNDRASSVVVQRGRWQLCSDAQFRGQCVIIERGQYPSLAAMGMNNRVSSLRPAQGHGHYAPPPPQPVPYAYYPRYGEKLYQANVVAVRAVVGPPEHRCWIERQQVVQDTGPNVPGAIIGGVIGGVLGHQIGGGRGNDVATAIGAIGGAAVGANVGTGQQVTTQDVRRCQAVPGSGRPDYWDVTYVFRGRTHRVQLSAPPGATITVNQYGDPRM
ncbi:MAG: glycine zipper 2TM domain-containing protein [Proteobacteria bacterium]|nr:glycine zipper 2TM domain-containing protein [Pseudomonadota bacterium]